MDSMLETVLFYLISFGIILAAIGVIASRSAVYSVLSLVTAMGLMAGLFVLLKAFLVATILILVYAGAILVLFLFVVMLIDPAKAAAPKLGLGLSPMLSVALAALFMTQAYRVIRTLPQEASGSVHGTAQALGLLLFNEYLLPFELTSFILLAAVVSVVVLAKKTSQ